MSEALAEVLSDIDDVETINRILGASGNTVESSDIAGSLNQPALTELYERYKRRRQNRSPTTIAQYKRTIPTFIEFSNDKDITTPNGISTELVDLFVDELQTKYDSDATILTYTKNIRSWIKWLHDRQLCSEPVYQLLNQDKLGLSPKARDEAIPEEDSLYILGNLKEKRFGSRYHALMELVWNAGPRLGDVHSVDLCDFDPENTEIRFRHRPSTGTRLKNGDYHDGRPGDGERNVELKETVIKALQHYIAVERPEVTDEYGRKPLFTTRQGRASKSTLRRWIYESTSCRWAPDDSDTSCDGSCNPDSDVCECSYYPHAIRRGAIVNHLSGGLRPDYASDRFDVSTEVIKEHYDPRTKHERKQDRSESVRSAW
jgi:site-specific recombinase XerC